MTYTKIRFTSAQHGSTAGLVIESRKLHGMSITEISRLFPVTEFRKMIKMECSPDYSTWNEAFLHSFEKES